MKPAGCDILLRGYPSSVQYPIMASYGNMPFSREIVKRIMMILKQIEYVPEKNVILSIEKDSFPNTAPWF
jgi:hypothetical protein